MPDRPTLRALLFAATAWLSCALVSQPAAAQVPTLGATPEPAETAEVGARKHFERALELYRGGNYAPALSELKRAAELDPNGKDLFFNLALVHEKLGQLEEAIAALERFRELEQDAAERERAAVTIIRLRGALEAARLPGVAAPAPAPSPCPPPTPTPAPAPASWQGRQALLIGTASVAVVSLVVGVVFGAQALSDDVSGESTSNTLSAEALRERAASAEREALVADVAFALAAASAGTFVGVWVLSPAQPATRTAGITLKGTF